MKWPVEQPLVLRQIDKQQTWIVHKTHVSEYELAKLPATREALSRYTEYGSRPVTSEGAVSVVAGGGDSVVGVSRDEVYLKLAQLLDRLNGRQTFKDQAQLIKYIAAQLNAEPAQVAGILRDHSINKDVGLFTVSVSPDSFEPAVSFNARPLNKFPRTARYIQEHLTPDSYFSRAMQAHKSAEADKAAQRNTRLDLIQRELLSLARPDGYLPVNGPRSVMLLLGRSMQGVTEGDLRPLLTKKALVQDTLLYLDADRADDRMPEFAHARPPLQLARDAGRLDRD